MSEEFDISQAESPILPTEELPQKKSLDLDNMRVGYLVGLDISGNEFIFEVFGTDKGLIELLGIHQHAGHHIKSLYDNKMMKGDRLTHEVGRAVATINNKLDVLAEQNQPINEV